MLGGAIHATGTLVTGDKPDYTIAAEMQKLNPTAVGQLLGQNWRGGTLDANGKIELAGYTRSDLADRRRARCTSNGATARQPAQVRRRSWQISIAGQVMPTLPTAR